MTCPTCGGPFQEDGIWFSHANDCADALAEEQAGCCEKCGGLMCPHDICINNWCNRDSECLDCYHQKQAEFDAEAEAQYWSHPGWKEVFGEDQ